MNAPSRGRARRIGLLCLPWLIVALLAGCAALPEIPRAKAAEDPRLASIDRLLLVTVANPPPAGATRAGSTLPGYNVGAAYTAGGGTLAVVKELALAHHLRRVTAWPILPLKMYCVVFEIAPEASRDAVLGALTADRRVLIAQPMQRFGVLAVSVAHDGAATAGAAPSQPYNDPYFRLQNGFETIDAGEAQQWSQGSGVRVAVIDTGVDATHPDLAGQIVAQRNFVDDDAGQFAADRHGTAIAGIIAAVANNHQGIVGIAPGARLLALKACWQTPDSGQPAQCNSLTLAEALAVAIESDVQIINLSLGGPSDPLLTALVEEALRHRIVVVGAVPGSHRAEGFPSGIRGVLATDAGDIAADADAAAAPGAVATLYAPGKDIVTLAPRGHYDFVSGSSLATAHVSGAVALILAKSPRLDATSVRAMLASSEAARVVSGATSINVCAVLAALDPARVCASKSAAAAASHGRTTSLATRP